MQDLLLYCFLHHIIFIHIIQLMIDGMVHHTKIRTKPSEAHYGDMNYLQIRMVTKYIVDLMWLKIGFIKEQISLIYTFVCLFLLYYCFYPSLPQHLSERECIDVHFIAFSIVPKYANKKVFRIDIAHWLLWSFMRQKELKCM